MGMTTIMAVIIAMAIIIIMDTTTITIILTMNITTMTIITNMARSAMA